MPVDVLMEAARNQYFKLVCRPGKQFVSAIRDLEFAFNWGNRTQSKLVSDPLLQGLFSGRPGCCTAFVEGPWLFGTLKANHLGFLNAPVSWLLGHEERNQFSKTAKVPAKVTRTFLIKSVLCLVARIVRPSYGLPAWPRTASRASFACATWTCTQAPVWSRRKAKPALPP